MKSYSTFNHQSRIDILPDIYADKHDSGETAENIFISPNRGPFEERFLRRKFLRREK